MGLLDIGFPATALFHEFAGEDKPNESENKYKLFISGLFFRGKLHIPRVVFCLPVLLVTCAGVFAQTVDLPDSARPGAVRPQDQDRQRIPKEPPGEVMEVPPVIERPFEADAGPRVQVERFNLVDAGDLPEHDIDLDEVRALLQDQMADYPDGLTIGQLQGAADAVTNYYRERGLILAQAVVPVQTVDDGVVDIEIYEGRLSRVLAEGNEMYWDDVLREPFRHLIGKPITKDEIESALLQLTDFPGLTVFGVFQPGRQVGTADIVLRVQEESRFDVSYRGDNHGLQETGRGRFRPTVEWNNITGGADRLTLSVQQTYQPKNNTFYSVNYDRYLGRGFSGGVTWTRNIFDVGGEFADQEITGETRQVGAYVEKNWLRSRQMNLSTRLGFATKESNTRTRGRFTNEDNLSVFTFEAVFDNVDTRFRGINFATLELSRGVNDLLDAMGSHLDALDKEVGFRPSRQAGQPDGRFASGQFAKVFLTASRLQTIRPNLSLLLRGEYQWTTDFLVPMEQYSVGGPDNVRAFPPAQILLDRAQFLSAELILNMPFITDVQAFGNRTWGELVQISAFYDHARGRLNKPLPNDPSGNEHFKGAGVQARFTLPGTIESRLIFAWEVGSDEAENERSPQIWGDFTYRF